MSIIKKLSIAISLIIVSGANAQTQYQNRVVVIPLFGDESTWRGSWSVGTDYKVSDIIEEGGSSYIATKAHTASLANMPPDAEFWDLVAASGANGAAGADGAQGQAGSDGAQGPQGIPGPAGANGSDGAQGPQGIPGPAGANGNDGAQGPQGIPGPAGANGSDGAQGPQGMPGPAGANGSDGAQGPQGMPGPAGAAGPQGPQGIPGPAGGGGGAFGDGTAGALNITTDSNWSINFQSNTNFTSCDIASGQTLTVPTGTIIRCTENFTNNGTIQVLPWTSGADGSTVISLSGQSSRPAATGNNNGIAYSDARLRGILFPGFEGGGNGDDGNGSPNIGGAAGGTLVIRASGTFTNTGTLRSNGGNASTVNLSGDQAGGGGGAGGIFILASKGNMTNSGVIQVNGGNGSNGGSADDDHAGGGGGGGLIHFLAPNANSVMGSISISGGSPGAHNPSINNGSSGGSGGAMGGNGGKGGRGTGSATSPILAPESGSAGKVFRTQVASPGSLFNP